NGLFLIALDPLVIRPLRRLKTVGRVLQAIVVTLCWTLSLGFFRAQGWDGAVAAYSALGNSGEAFAVLGMSAAEFNLLLGLLGGMMAVEWIHEKWPVLVERLHTSHFLVRWTVYYSLSMAIVLLGSYGMNVADAQFIYFQF
ncbi:MAG: hypothetical protein ACPH8E_04645, partial [Flavobacteriales bacterium]